MDNSDLGPAMESSGHRDRAKALELRIEMLESTIINHNSALVTLMKRTESLHEAELEMKIVITEQQEEIKKLRPN